MTATLFAVQNVITGGQIVGPGTVFSTDDISAAALLTSGLAATFVPQETADAAALLATPTDDPENSTG